MFPAGWRPTLPCGTLPPRDDHSRTRDDKNWKTMEKTYPGKGPKTNLSGYRSSLPFLLVETSASLRVTSALLVVTRTLLIYFKFNSNSFLLLLVRHLLLLAWHLLLLGPKTNLSGRRSSLPFLLNDLRTRLGGDDEASAGSDRSSQLAP